MQAVKRFDPDRGFRLATYAMWWIRASIQEYILRSCSLEEMDPTPDQKALFADRLGVQPQEVIEMNRRLGGDSSLNSPLRIDGEGEWQDMLMDESASQEAMLVQSEESDNRHSALRGALGQLNPRERRIFEARRLLDEPLTLEALSEEFGVSRERIRQIEVRAYEKVETAVRRNIAAIESRAS